MAGKKAEWREGSFLDNLNAAALHVGYSNLPLAWGLASVPWKSTTDRDDFLRALTTLQIGGSNG